MSLIKKIRCTSSCRFNKESGDQKTGFILVAGTIYKVPEECTPRNAIWAVDSGWAEDITIEKKIIPKLENKIDKKIEKKRVEKK